MAKLKHIALTTHEIEKAASFYKDVFDMEEVGRSGATHIYLSDGEMNLTIRACKTSDDPDVGAQGEQFSGIHHIGFVVDDVMTCADHMEKAGATLLTSLDPYADPGASCTDLRFSCIIEGAGHWVQQEAPVVVDADKCWGSIRGDT